MTVCPAMTQISLGIRPVWSGCPGWSESLLCAQWVAKDPSFLHAFFWSHWALPRLIWDIAGRTCHFVGFVMRWLKSRFTIPFAIVAKCEDKIFLAQKISFGEKQVAKKNLLQKNRHLHITDLGYFMPLNRQLTSWITCLKSVADQLVTQG